MAKQENQVTGFEAVQAEELKRLQTRREKVNAIREQEERAKVRQDSKTPGGDSVGLALSGGGVRSATFNLGLLQAFNRYKLLQFVDYLSTVSGGGYIGSSLTWFCSHLEERFPFGTSRKDNLGQSGDIVAWLRAHGSYLIPGDGLNFWALTSSALIGILINLLVLVPVFLLLFSVLSFNKLGPLSFVPEPLVQMLFHDPQNWDVYGWLMGIGLVHLAVFVVLAVVFAFTTGNANMRQFLWQRKSQIRKGKTLMFGILFIFTGTIPWVYGYINANLAEWIEMSMSSFSIAGILSMAGGLFGKKSGKESQGGSSGLLSLGLSLFIYGIFLWFYHFMQGGFPPPLWLYPFLGISLLLALFANINHLSMHRYYRNRLMEAYFPYQIMERPPQSADQCKISDIPQTDAPFHIVNTNLQTVGSKNSKLQKRGGDSFVFTPLYSGSESTGYSPSNDYADGNMNLATAFAISGAAVDPNTYATRSTPLTFLMTLLNVRQGYWIQNPKFAPSKKKPAWYYYMFREMFGSGLSEEDAYIHLSDGGHFENLGIYELIRRRCRYIIASDASADPGWNFGDLARAIELIRVDFAAQVTLDIEPLRPQGEERISQRPFVLGDITYNDGSKGQLLYVKTAYISGLPADVFGYRRENPEFPDQSTADQFFDERQFEAYRELGYQVGKLVCDSSNCDDLEALFKKIRAEQEKEEKTSA